MKIIHALTGAKRLYYLNCPYTKQKLWNSWDNKYPYRGAFGLLFHLASYLDLNIQIDYPTNRKFFTMKWTLLLAFALATATACEKSNAKPEEATLKASSDSPTDPNNKQTLVGKWRLVEYWQDKGDGTGQWIQATDPDEVTFTADGRVTFSGNSPFASKGFSLYKIVEANKVELSNGSGDVREIFYFNRKSDTELIFNPQYRENCSRKYQKVG